ncbi:hypothetical protein AAG906_004910 [Vitis piasezkii]
MGLGPSRDNYMGQLGDCNHHPGFIFDPKKSPLHQHVCHPYSSNAGHGLIVGRFQWKEAWRSVKGDAALLAWKERERFVEEYFPTHPINTTFVNPGFHSISLHRGIVFLEFCSHFTPCSHI